MITLNGKKFLKVDEAGECDGYYRVYPKQITLLDKSKQKIGVITKNKVLACAVKQDDGKWWYSYADIPLIGRHESYLKQCEEIQKALDDHGF